MDNFLGAVIGLVIGGIVIQVGINIFGNFDNSIDCSTLSTQGNTSCNNAKSSTWLAIQILPYGLIIAAVLMFVGNRAGYV